MNLPFIIVILLLLYFLYNSREFFSNCSLGRLLSSESFPEDGRITFMSKQDLQTFFKTDPDGYFRSFNSVNLHAFGHSTVDELIKSSVNVADDFSESEKI